MNKRIKSMFLVCIGLLLACQPTPQTDVIINRGEEDLEALIQTTPAPDTTSVVDNVTKSLSMPNDASTAEESSQENILVYWKEDYPLENGKAKVKIDANVTVPNIADWSVFAAEKIFWQTEDIERMCKALAEDSIIYAGTYTPTKAYYADLLSKVQNSEKIRIIDQELSERGEMTTEEWVLQSYQAAPSHAEQQPTNWEKYHQLGKNEPLLSSFFQPVLQSYFDIYVDAGKTLFQISASEYLIQDEDIV